MCEAGRHLPPHAGHVALQHERSVCLFVGRPVLPGPELVKHLAGRGEPGVMAVRDPVRLAQRLDVFPRREPVIPPLIPQPDIDDSIHCVRLEQGQEPVIRHPLGTDGEDTSHGTTVAESALMDDLGRAPGFLVVATGAKRYSHGRFNERGDKQDIAGVGARVRPGNRSVYSLATPHKWSTAMEIGEILSELTQNCGFFPREAVEEAIRRREEITPHMLRALQEPAQHPPGSEEAGAYFLPLYAMFLLAQFRERRAYPPIVELCKLPRETLDSLLGDTITEGLPRIIASVFDGNTAPIKSVIENASVDEYVRGSALRSLSILVHEGVLARADVIAYFTELFRGKLEQEYSHVWDVLASEAVDLHATTLADDIRAGYEEGLLLTGYMHPKEVDRAFALPEETALAQSKERCDGLIDDVVKEMHWWACFKPKNTPRTKTTDQFRTPAGRHDPGAVVRAEPKVGRNASCPCGSGKKYKKCCGAGKSAP